ncbi:unnamed protein product [Prorocentrum cordatum]|uniref:Protein xylosyltransferase n=1 Tax=Prorocentrum cordatum TaxID=2364126 RepID=A0ABN9QEW3_9DINO|nr:unnamed protein product [Polarella glacialis]CAK0804477.1 unnamed protein product [Polarella glacialis]|mmetsp:Transcript_36058/g.96665  ORF Transcript_36058/g.96665 Transcript_36058/m.96665 type:complete len:297 (+) Transcript_36058:2-892(+)
MLLALLLAAAAAPAPGAALSEGSLGQRARLRPGGNASRPRVLFFVTTYASDEHMSYMRCQADLYRRAPGLREADVLLHVGEDEASAAKRTLQCATDACVHSSRAAWQELLSAWPMPAKTVKFSRNPGKQGGAKKAMHDALTSGWFRGYDWVIRANPDVIFYDDSQLFSLMESSKNWAVVMKCGGTQTNTDFFAVRPDRVSVDAFSEWNSTPPDAEGLTNQAFQQIYKEDAYAFLKPGGHQLGCHLMDGGVYHAARLPTCELVLDQQGWQQSFKGGIKEYDHRPMGNPWQEAWRLGS